MPKKPDAKPDAMPETDPSVTPRADTTPHAELSYEAAVEELESIINQIESGDIGLEQSIRRYERGAALLKHCRAILGHAEQRITELDASTLPQPATDTAETDDA